MASLLLSSIQRALLSLIQSATVVTRRLMPASAAHRLASLARPVISAVATPVGVRFEDRPVALVAWQPLLPRSAFASGPIVLVNNALAAGGAERQIVNTLRGIAERRGVTGGLLCLRLHETKEMDFFLPAFRDFPGFIRNAMPAGEAEAKLRSILPPEAADKIRDAIAWLPHDVQADIFRLVAEFAILKPSVVHGWQDATSIIAAYAAWLVGVPRILVSARNLAPPHFRYMRSYMRDAYREIASCAPVVMINNSEAGARDYARWLDLPPERFTVKRNGVDTAAIHRPAPQAIADFRAKLGVPAAAKVVGSMMRFFAEKQPLLWIEVAALIAQRHADCYFVLFGDGPMQNETVALAKARGIGDRLICPGMIADTAAALSLLDVFLMTSKMEGTPNVVLEASLLGVPVVSTDAGGAREAIAQGVTGYVAPDFQPQSLARCVLTILDEPDWCEGVKREGPAFVAQRFGLERMIEDTMALYGLRAG